MADALMGTNILALDHFLKVVALGIAIFSPVSVIVWAAIERHVRHAEVAGAVRKPYSTRI